MVICDSLACVVAMVSQSFVHRSLSALNSWSPDSRVIILPAVLKHLRYHIVQRDDQQEKSLESLGGILMQLHDMYQDVRMGGVLLPI